jgi:hypothetical protein
MGLRLDFELHNHPLLKRSERSINIFTPAQLADFKDFCESCESMGITKKPDPLEHFSSLVNPLDPEIEILTLVCRHHLTNNAYFHELVMSVMTMEDFSIEELSKMISKFPEFTKFCIEIGHAPLEVFSVGLGYLVANQDVQRIFVLDGKTFVYSAEQIKLLDALSMFLDEKLFL